MNGKRSEGMKTKQAMMFLALAAATVMTACTTAAVPEDEVKRIDKPQAEQEVLASTDTKETEEVKATEAKKSYSGFFYHAVSKNGEGDIYINMPSDEVVALLGEPESTFEAPSCALDGMDKVYTYDHCEIYIAEYPDQSLVSAIYLTDDLSSTPEGLTVGDTDKKMRELYGDPYKSDGYEYTYRKEDSYLRVQVNVGKVTYIYYMLKTE